MKYRLGIAAAIVSNSRRKGKRFDLLNGTGQSIKFANGTQNKFAKSIYKSIIIDV